MAIDGGVPRTWGGFLGHVSDLMRRLQGYPRGRWVVSCQSTYALTVSLSALWQRGDVAVLPPNAQRESLLSAAEGTCGLLSDRDDEPPCLLCLRPLAVGAEPDGGHTVRALEPSAVVLELLTSGSTGRRKSVHKTLQQVDAELQVLERTFGARIGSATVLGTVSHQHIYGLWFRALWPLASGRVFVSESILFWPALVESLRRHSPAVLVGSPAHLAQIDVLPPGTMEGSVPVFSSGGPLGAANARAVLERLGGPILEVFGSTETGGLGWRERSGAAEVVPWTPLAGVRIEPADDERLWASSPFIAEHRALLGDRGCVDSDERFTILGRADRIVKIADKRMSLDEMEQRLSEHPAVDRVALTVVEPGGAMRRRLLAALIVPAAGEPVPVRHRDLEQVLRRYLAAHYERVMIPRRFVFVEALPVDAQGKLPQLSVMSLLSST